METTTERVDRSFLIIDNMDFDAFSKYWFEVGIRFPTHSPYVQSTPLPSFAATPSPSYSPTSSLQQSNTFYMEFEHKKTHHSECFNPSTHYSEFFFNPLTHSSECLTLYIYTNYNFLNFVRHSNNTFHWLISHIHQLLCIKNFCGSHAALLVERCLTVIHITVSLVQHKPHSSLGRS